MNTPVPVDVIEGREDREPWSRAVARLRWRVPVLSHRDEVVAAGFALLWVLALANFGRWWFDPAHLVSTPRTVATSAVLGVSLLMPWWLVVAVRRMRRPSLDLPVPDLRVALIVTKSPAEPWSVVQRTLAGMLHQDHHGPYDVWLADEAPHRETLRWCAAHGVKVSSRADEPRYHRQTWPRRTRSKEGNLAYFYDRWGYDLYDVVVQFDADHVPEPEYLDSVLRCFADPNVGYVAAPSICDANADRSWSARGRLYREATLHGPVQAGHNDGMAPTCIGSHYAVRTEALREVGGVGPELAEDFSTSFIMNVCGWRGAFALDATAHGDGPDTFADAMVQELQWSRSLQVLLMRHCRPLWQDLPARERWKLRFALWWYPLFAAQMLLGFAMVTMAIFTGTPWVRVNLLEFFAHTGLMTMVMIAFVAWLRSRQVLRPVDAKIISWEAMLFQIARWPWVLIGVVQGAVGSLLDRQFTFKVTPKGDGAERDLPLLSIAPLLALTVCASSALVAAPDPGEASGYYVLLIVAAVTYAIASVAIVVLHLRENPGLPVRRLLPHLAAAGTAIALIIVAMATRASAIFALGGGGLSALDPAGVLQQPTAWLWMVGAVVMPLYVLRLRATRTRNEFLTLAMSRPPRRTPATLTPRLDHADRPSGGLDASTVRRFDQVLAPVGMDLAGLILLAQVATGSSSGGEVHLDRLVWSADARSVYRALSALLDAGYLDGDLGGRSGGGTVRITPAGRRRLAAATALLRGHRWALEGVNGPESLRPEQLTAHRNLVFAIGRPAAPMPVSR